MLFCYSVPHKPEVTVDKTLTSAAMIQGTILQTICENDSFTLYVNEKMYSDYTTTKSSYVIRGLNPGQKYKIQAKPMFCSFVSVITDAVEECTGMEFFIKYIKGDPVQHFHILCRSYN